MYNEIFSKKNKEKSKSAQWGRPILQKIYLNQFTKLITWKFHVLNFHIKQLIINKSSQTLYITNKSNQSSHQEKQKKNGKFPVIQSFHIFINFPSSLVYALFNFLLYSSNLFVLFFIQMSSFIFLIKSTTKKIQKRRKIIQKIK